MCTTTNTILATINPLSPEPELFEAIAENTAEKMDLEEQTYGGGIQQNSGLCLCPFLQNEEIIRESEEEEEELINS